MRQEARAVVLLLLCAAIVFADRQLRAAPRLPSDAVVGDRVEPHWFAEGTRFWYQAERVEGNWEFILVDAMKGKRGPAFDHQRLAEKLTDITKKERSPFRLELRYLLFDDALTEMRFQFEGDWFLFQLSKGELTETKRPSGSDAEQAMRRPRKLNSDPPRSNNDKPTPQKTSANSRSPDGLWRVRIVDDNVQLQNVREETTATLTQDGKDDYPYRREVFWSPDSSKFVVFRETRVEPRRIHIVESSPPKQLQPKLRTLSYNKPGDTLPKARPVLFDADSTKQIPVSNDEFENPWSIEDLRWSKDSSHFTFVFNQRGHQVLRLVRVDAASGAVTVKVDERSDTFIDYAYKKFSHHLDNEDVIWMSERDGWNHLYYITADGNVRNQITQGEWIVRKVDWVDETKRQIWFRLSGYYHDQDPYYLHFARINFDGTNLVLLTAGNGGHEIRYTSDGRFILDRYSRVDMPPVTELRRVNDGSLVCELERADWSKLLASGWRAPERFVAKARDGKTDIFGLMFRPRNFDPEKSYPIVERIYAGPQSSYVPKTFTTRYTSQTMADEGFIVVQIDGLGTSNRSKAFHDVCSKNLVDAGLPDRRLWIEALAKKYSFIDLKRVGIYGGSAGGQNAVAALLHHGDFYHVGCADCGCHDNRMDKIWWNELWMGWPVGPHYAEQSNVTNAHKLQGELMLIVGEVDTNVDPASTMQVVDALVKADKNFDLVVIPGQGHGAAGTSYGRRRQVEFFKKHLLQIEPRGNR